MHPVHAIADYIGSSLGLKVAGYTMPDPYRARLVLMSPQPTPGDEHIVLLAIPLVLRQVSPAGTPVEYRWCVAVPNQGPTPIDTYSTIQQYISVWYEMED
jgi:hypothetical protein